MDVLVGRVTHYYDKIGVAIVTVLHQTLKVGDMIKFSGHDQEFTQKIASMQVEHEKISDAREGMTVGIQVEKKVKENDQVFLVS